MDDPPPSQTTTVTAAAYAVALLSGALARYEQSEDNPWRAAAALVLGIAALAVIVLFRVRRHRERARWFKSHPDQQPPLRRVVLTFGVLAVLIAALIPVAMAQGSESGVFWASVGVVCFLLALGVEVRHRR